MSVSLGVKEFINHFRKVLEAHLNPLDILQKMPSFPNSDEIYQKVSTARLGSLEQVNEFLRAWEAYDEEGSLKEFLNAVNECEDQKWLHPLLSGSLEDQDVESVFADLENVEKVKRLMQIMRPQLDGVKVYDCLVILEEFISRGEYDFLLQKCQSDGNHYSIWWLIHFILRKEKQALKAFCEYLKDTRHNCYDSQEPLIEIVLEHIGSYCGFISNACLKNLLETQNGIDELQTRHKKKPSSSGCKDKMSPDVEEYYSSLHAEGESSAGETKSANWDAQIEEATELKDVVDGLQEIHLNVAPAPSAQEPILRNYQKELVSLAEQGKNVIISAPPGSGKTIVAWHVIKTYLEKNNRKPAPVLMFTPGGALAVQQCERLQRYLPKDFKVELMSGSAGHLTFSETMESHVIVLTPQILLNELKRKSTPKIVKGIDSFGLFIFDECHRCTKGHPYNTLMKNYFALKFESTERIDLPQIVGLSATLGIGKTSDDLGEAVNAVKTLCANINAIDGVVSVKEHLDELHSHISHPDEVMISLEARAQDDFFSKITNLMKDVEEVLNGIVGDCGCPMISSSDDQSKQAFKQWCAVFKDEVAKQNKIKDKHDERVVHTCVDYLKQYNEALDYHLKYEVIDVVEHIEAWLDKQKLTTLEQYHEREKKIYQSGRDALKILKPMAQDTKYSNPNLKIMEDLIAQKFRKDSNSKGMIMVEMRKYTYALKRWAEKNENVKKLRPEIFTGTGRVKGEGKTALTHQQQKQIMDDFREGKHKLLICTPDSAGEGIDVVDCNFVIIYDIMTNEITVTQIKGRARKQGGEVYQLSSAKVAQRDHLNKRKTKLMESARTRIEREIEQNLAQFQSELIVIQKEEYKFEQLKKLQSTPEKNDVEYMLLCKRCSAQACSSYYIRAIQSKHHICIDQNFEDKYKTEALKRKIQMGRDWEPKQTVLCKSCGDPWGIECEWRGRVTKALIHIRSFKLLRRNDMNGKALTPKQWKNVPFSVAKPTMNEIA